LMRRPPPAVTLRPYPTLFRSGRGTRLELQQNRAGLGLEPKRAADAAAPDRGCRVVERRKAGTLQRGEQRSRHALTGAARLARDQDRKSTRLNSSHVKISYAVF